MGLKAVRSIIKPPPPGAGARFDKSFGQRFIVTVDTEEEFDWTRPIDRTSHGLDHVARIARFQSFCEAHGVVPIYLVDWPIASSELAAEILREPVASGKAEVGVQLHPWVSPPFDEEVCERNSYAGNLPEETERAKLLGLRDRIEESFGRAPLIYRAGRYGLGPNTARILAEAGIAIDSSVRSKFNYSARGGPDYRTHPLTPYWVDDEHSLLELPLTSVFWGMLRRQGDWIYPRLWRMPSMRGVLAKLGLLERIPLTPEGVSVDEAIRGIDMALDDELPMLVFSFHSPSLDIGHTPYVRSEHDLEALYDWWGRIFAYLEMRKVSPSCVAEILEAVER